MANDENIPEHFPILFRLTRRCVLFFLLLKIAVTLLYISGNYQHFLDSSQKEILFCFNSNFAMPCFFCYMPARGKFFLSFFQKRTQNSLYHTYSSHVHNFLSCNKCRSRNLSYTDNCKRILGNKKKEMPL